MIITNQYRWWIGVNRVFLFVCLFVSLSGVLVRGERSHLRNGRERVCARIHHRYEIGSQSNCGPVRYQAVDSHGAAAQPGAGFQRFQYLYRRNKPLPNQQIHTRLLLKCCVIKIIVMTIITIMMTSDFLIVDYNYFWIEPVMHSME